MSAVQSGNATWSSNGGEGRGRKRSATEEVGHLGMDFPKNSCASAPVQCSHVWSGAWFSEWDMVGMVQFLLQTAEHN